VELPADVEAVLRRFYTCEMTTLNARGEPLTWPVEPFFDDQAGTLVATASIAFPVKALNARRNPRVSMLYSDPTGSGLKDAPAVLVQGDASVTESREWTPQSAEHFRTSVLRQPDSRKFITNPVARRLFTFYFQRLTITVRPRRILVWAHRDFASLPTEVSFTNVE
jgi:pyridoxamine 5'-phosphate oxidase-like protein